MPNSSATSAHHLRGLWAVMKLPYIKEGVLIFPMSFGTFGFKARCWGPFCCVPADQEKYLAHEIQHSKDWRADPLRSVWRRMFNWRYRLWMELRGYHLSDNIIQTAHEINSYYNIPRSYSPFVIESLQFRAVNEPFEKFEKWVT